MSLVIQDTSTVPPNGWIYPGLNGYEIVVRNYSLFYEEIVKHYQGMGQTPPTPQEVTDYVCRNLRVPCYDDQTRQPLINKWLLGIAEPRKPCGKPCS